MAILIADSGSTKTDWVCLQPGSDTPQIEVHTVGLNPFHVSDNEIRSVLQHELLPQLGGTPVDAVYYADMNEWLYEYINVPAWGHTLFTVRRDLLYGDYFIGMEEEWSGMATHIQFGSDTFKTWDDIAVYFERLGGQ